MISLLVIGALIVAGAFTAWHPRGKLASVPVFVALGVGVWVNYQDALGRAKPAMVSDMPEGTEVRGASMVDGQSIEVYVQRPGEDGTRVLSLPWSNDLAQQLQDGMRENQEQGAGVVVGQAGDRDGDGLPDGDPVIRALPQPGRPPKE